MADDVELGLGRAAYKAEVDGSAGVLADALSTFLGRRVTGGACNTSLQGRLGSKNR